MITIQERVPLAPKTTFKIGGEARFFTEAHSLEDIREALAWAREKEIPHFILAGGSNVLVPDEGMDALVIRITSPTYGVSENVIEAEVGCDLLALIRASTDEGLSGWEKLAGIPGTLGGAIRGNAGAFGMEIQDVLAEATAFDMQNEKVRVFSNAECEFGYRGSFFKRHPEWIILSARIALAPGAQEESRRLMAETIAEREKRHIQNIKAAGSYFMNPHASKDVCVMFEHEKGVASREGRVPAGWLIEKTGLKGTRVGGAMSSNQHPNYLINTGNATAKEVVELAALIKNAIKERFGIALEEEVALL